MWKEAQGALFPVALGKPSDSLGMGSGLEAESIWA